jgi:serum/glucocorticoid-regulated kinase 2
MEMGHSEIVHLLVDAGADINLTHPVWPKPVWPVPGHICQPVPRAVYVEVRAGLEAAVAARRGQSLAKNPS